MKRPIEFLVATVLLLTGLPAAANESVTFGPTDWNYNSDWTIPWVVSIGRTSDTKLTFSLSIDPNPIDVNGISTTFSGDILGFGFDSTISDKLAAFVSSSADGAQITSVKENSRDCGQGCNFNGATDDPFDWVVGIGEPGNSDNVTAFEFSAESNDGALPQLKDITFSRVGIRSQSTTANPGFDAPDDDSTKDLNITAVYHGDDDVVISSAVPEISALHGAAALAALAALMMLTWERRRRAA